MPTDMANIILIAKLKINDSNSIHQIINLWNKIMILLLRILIMVSTKKDTGPTKISLYSSKIAWII